MGLIKYSIRLLITTGSVLGFLLGWVALAHAGKPAAINAENNGGISQSISPLPTLVPLNSLSDSPRTMQAQTVAPSFAPMPRLRTRGS